MPLYFAEDSVISGILDYNVIKFKKDIFSWQNYRLHDGHKNWWKMKAWVL